MPRPKSKTELLDQSEQNFTKLLHFIDGLDEQEQHKSFPPGTMNRNIRDVLAHLHQWHLMMLKWYEIGMARQKPDMPAKGYTWRDTSKLNQKIWQEVQKIELGQVKAALKASHLQLISLIKQHTDKELFEKKRYSWTGSTSLGAYLISASSSHYDWALKLIKKAKKP